MVRTTGQSRQASDEPQSFLGCLRYFVTPYVWKQAQRALRRHKSIRWQTQPLIFVLLLMTWCCGDSVGERFETARAFYVACYQRKRRPGKTPEGFQKALARVPTLAFRQVAAALRQRLAQVFENRPVALLPLVTNLTFQMISQVGGHSVVVEQRIIYIK